MIPMVIWNGVIISLKYCSDKLNHHWPKPNVVSGEKGGNANTNRNDPTIINGIAPINPSRIAQICLCDATFPAIGVSVFSKNSKNLLNI